MLYDLLNECQEDYYLSQGVSANNLLMDFEAELIKEGHLSVATANGYKALFRQLSKQIYFSPPLIKDDFNNKLLYNNPNDLLDCMQDTYQIDSSEIQQLSYYLVADSIRKLFIAFDEIPIQEVFGLYASQLPDNEMEMSFVRNSLLLFLYRWYFTSKYDRDIPLEGL